MKEFELGIEGERQARILLKKLGFEIQSPDWLATIDKEWICVEVKKKERFTPPPFEGHGLDKRQIYLRNHLLADKNIRTFLLIFEIGSEDIFGQFIDILEKGNKFETKNGVMIYPLSSFKNYKKGNIEKLTSEELLKL